MFGLGNNGKLREHTTGTFVWWGIGFGGTLVQALGSTLGGAPRGSHSPFNYAYTCAEDLFIGGLFTL